MLPIGVLIALGIGTIAMWIPIAIQAVWHKMKLYKTILLALVLLFAGVVGIYLWFFIENLEFGGRSLYGAIFLVPIILIPCSKWLQTPYTTLTDISAPAGCVMFAVMKIKCLIDGCCGGKMIYRDADGVAIYFPSQKVEALVAIVIFVILIYLSFKLKNRGYIYGWFFLLYGATRFVLNFYRRFYRPFLWVIPAGHLWSVISVVIGIAWLIITRKSNKISKILIAE